MKMSSLTRDGTAEPVSRDQILRREREQENIHFPRSADHVQDWQPYYPVDPYFCYMCDPTYIHNVGEKPTAILTSRTFSVLVANPKKLLYTVANPAARGLLT